MVDIAEIRIWDQLVGAARWDEKQQLTEFQYAKDFLAHGWDLSPLKMPLLNGDRVYRFPELRKRKESSLDTFKGLPGLLADSLPDRYGNQLINIWLAKNGRPANSMNPVEQLCFMGSRAMGALIFEPAYPQAAQQPFMLEIASLVEVAQRLLLQREAFHTNLNNDEQQTLRQLLKIGTSAGGARPKAVIAYNPTTGDVKSGQGISPDGYEQWLIKLDGVSDAQFGQSSGWGRVEYAYYLMAIEAGIEMTQCMLLEEKGRAHFMTKRFDRAPNNIRHHIQTLCGMQHYDYNDMFAFSYEQLFQTMRLLRLSYPEAEQMFRRMVFNVLATNCDDHTKNFAFRLQMDGKWELTPAYDVCYAYNPDNLWVKQQTLSINGKNTLISKKDLMTLADANNIRNAEKIIDEINHVVLSWSHFSALAKVNTELKKVIHDHLKTLS